MKIAFTSCVRYEAFKEQKEWDYIYDADPDYLFLLGDNIYMDYGIWPFTQEYVTAPRNYSLEKFTKVMETKYRNQFEKVPNFQKLLDKMRSKNGFFATWDDHDFAWNNAKGALVDKQKKEVSRKLFHKYTQCSTNMPHVYYHVDTPLARVIFLDNRYDAEKKGKDSKLISEEQFLFIEQALQHTLPYTILCGGITLTQSSEKWSQYPSQLQRLCFLLEKKERVLFLAGDVHYNKFVPAKFLGKLNCITPPQLIASGMHINLLGLGISADNRHNWGLLELEKDHAKVQFFNRGKIQQRKSEKASDWLQKNLF
ncbi:alkaline phosphatase D family protein [Pseudotenacibaculum haliotis]|uniref:Alkaline phosphatase D family protein n=1 Tax=Pseudotenacibaculum haliotis TaxID=1862138 RepID=A0ABW5LV79_9FLAO